ncbi:hypothetical protein [uncultured Ruminococcus sp.]|uniref:hypothetical protein n=1 Tax=uncultured Ruminococcus sp. TaxID=165186 RepID=UPI0025FA3BBB|nr:hypothetical protein [uncultured Ruminococcus sp.]
MFNNENIQAQGEFKPKLSGGALVAWIIAAMFLFMGIWISIEAYETEALIGFGIFAGFIGAIGAIPQLLLVGNAKKNVLVATERCIYCKSPSTKQFSYAPDLMEVPYDSIVNIKVTPEGLSRMNGDTVILYLPNSVISFHNVTNAPQIVMAIKNKVEEIKGPMPPMGYIPMLPNYGQPFGAQPYYQPMYAPMQNNYGQPPYAQPMQRGYGQPNMPPYGQPNMGYGQPNMPPYGGQPQMGYNQPNYGYPQNMQPNYQNPAPAQTGYGYNNDPVKHADTLTSAEDERPRFDPETGESIHYDDQPPANNGFGQQ